MCLLPQNGEGSFEADQLMAAKLNLMSFVITTLEFQQNFFQGYQTGHFTENSACVGIGNAVRIFGGGSLECIFVTNEAVPVFFVLAVCRLSQSLEFQGICELVTQWLKPFQVISMNLFQLNLLKIVV